MSNLLMLASYITLFSLNTIDAVTTKIALSKTAFEEKMPFTKKAIEELGLNRAMLFKSLMSLPFILPVIIFWNNEPCSYAITLAYMIPTVWLSYLVIHNCILLWNNRQNQNQTLKN